MATDDLQKIYKVFKLIRLLDPLSPKDVPQLIRLLDCSKSHVYRYLDLLERLGYPIETDSQHRKFIKFVSSQKDNTFEQEELQYIQELLYQNALGNPFRDGILQKLNRNLSLMPLADALPGLHRNRMLQLLRSAIELNNCVEIIGYRSLTSNTVSNRTVEPLEITGDYRYLIAWDKDKKDQRQFKIDRIEDVNLLDELINSEHIPSPMDLFGLTGTAWLEVKLELSDTAHHLLLEEFPLSRPFIRTTRGKKIFDGRVRNWKGIGRFVLGLPGEITIIAPKEFKQFIQEKIQDF